MDPLQASTLMVAVAFAFAFVSTLRFYRRKVSITPVEQKGALIPTLVISLAFLVGFISSMLSFFSLLTLPPFPTLMPPPSIDIVYPWELVAELVAPLFGFTISIAVVAALKRRRLYAIPSSLLIASYALSLLSPKHPLDDPFLSLWIAAGSLLLVIPMVLFGYLWRKTKRPTSFGMFIGLLLYFFYYLYNARTVSEYIGSLGFYLVPVEYFGHVELYQTLIGIAVLGVFDAVTSLFFVYWCFRYSEKKLGGEVIGYSLAVPVIASEVFLIILASGLVPIEYLMSLSMETVGAGIFILTGSYLYGRYRESKARQTLMLSMFSFFAGMSYLAFNIGQHIYLAVGRTSWLDLVTLSLGMITGGFLFLASTYALEKPSLVLLPPVVIVPLFILALIFSPMPLWLLVIMISAAMLMTVVPGALFGVLWRRMSKGKEKGRGRVLGIFFGFLLLLLSSPVQILSATVPDPVLFVSSPIVLFGVFVAFLGSLIFYLGISGRFDRWYYDRRR
jgi:hypothetical protein